MVPNSKIFVVFYLLASLTQVRMVIAVSKQHSVVSQQDLSPCPRKDAAEIRLGFPGHGRVQPPSSKSQLVQAQRHDPDREATPHSVLHTPHSTGYTAPFIGHTPHRAHSIPCVEHCTLLSRGSEDGPEVAASFREAG